MNLNTGTKLYHMYLIKQEAIEIGYVLLYPVHRIHEINVGCL